MSTAIGRAASGVRGPSSAVRAPAAAGAALRPASHQRHAIGPRDGARRTRRELGDEIAVALVLAARTGLLALGVEAGELRKVDRARVAQAGDDLLREVVLDLLGTKLACEAAQQVALVLAALALDLDRRQHVAVALGDREMQPQLVRDELLELLAYCADQRRVRSEMHLRVRRGTAAPEDVEARLARARRVTAGECRRRAQIRVASFRPVALAQHPSFQGHDQLR